MNTVNIRTRREKDLNRSQLALETVVACQRVLVQAKKSSELLQSICRQIVEVDGFTMAWVGLALNDDKRTIKSLASEGTVEGYLDSIKLSWKENGEDVCPAGNVIMSGKPFVVKDILTDDLVISWRGEALKRGYSSVLSIPLLNHGRTFGALTIYSDRSDIFEEDEVVHLRELANNLVYGIMALKNKNARHRIESELETNLGILKKTLGAIIQAFVRTIEVRDPYTAGHQKRVADLAWAMALEMGLSTDLSDGIRIAGIIHDIGKIYVPAEILSSPRCLTSMEFNLVKSHPQVGYDVLKSIEFPWPVAQIIRQHHERIDGSGYPHNLKGKDILIQSKILGVADVVEAMASHRPYRPALGMDRALSEIQNNNVILYDSRCVEACLKVFKEGQVDFSEMHGLYENSASRF